MKWVHRGSSSQQADWISKLVMDDRGRYLASAATRGVIQIWQLDGAECSPVRSLTLPRGSSRIEDLQFIPVSHRLICASAAVHILDALSGEQLARIERRPTRLAVHPEGEVLALGFSDHQIEIWNLATSEHVESFQGDPGPDLSKGRDVSAMAFGPRGVVLATAASDMVIHVWDLSQPGPSGSTRRPSLTLLGHKVAPYQVAFAPRGDRLYSTAETDRTYCWETGSGREVWSIHGGSCIAVSPNGEIAAIGGPNPIEVVDAMTGDTHQVLGYVSYLASVAFTPDGRSIISGGSDKRIHIWSEPHSRKAARLFDSEAWFTDLTGYYIELGFFQDLAGTSKAEVRDEVLRRFQAEYRKPPPERPRSDLDHLMVLALDRHRVWWGDLEADVCEANKVYVRFLADLANISEGHFEPGAVREQWETSTGPISLTFTSGDQRVQIHPDYQSDYIDIGVLRELNQRLESASLRFELVAPFDQTAFVVSLTSEQKQRLIRDLGWRFAGSSSA